jgi:hypothetical protein
MNGPRSPRDISHGRYPSTIVGGRRMYIDSTGGLHPTPASAINESMRIEGDLSRGAAGGCGQDPSRAPGGRGRGRR